MLDWQGEMVHCKHQQRILQEDIDVDVDIAAATLIGDVETTAVGTIFGRRDDDIVSQTYQHIPSVCNQIASVLSAINPTLDDNVLYQSMDSYNSLGKFQIAVGSTSARKGDCIVSRSQPVGVADSSTSNTFTPVPKNHPVGTKVGSTNAAA